MGRGRFVRLVFLGTSEFAVPSLTRLHTSGHRILAIVTRPDRPTGRGLKVVSSPVKRAAASNHLAILQPERLDSEVVETVRGLAPDLVVVVAYGLILPPFFLKVPPLGCINLHASLLPRYRGAAPVAHAILRGEVMVGVTTLLMDEGIDTGPILLQRQSPVGADESAGEVEARLSILGADLLLETLQTLARGRLEPRHQVVDHDTYAPKIAPGAARISWQRDSASVVNLIRATNPRPGAFTVLGFRRLKIWRAARGPDCAAELRDLPPGTVVAEEGLPEVLCGEGTTLQLREIQMEGRRRITGEEAVRGRLFGRGVCFGEASPAERK